jgi:2,3-bisphosphoglycerate-independent phosphoglycerate mutase
LDGRDCPPRSAEKSLEKTQALCEKLGVGTIASMIGRFYAMDRDNRWDRVQSAYELITDGIAEYRAKDPLSALQAAYDRDENDEFVRATSVVADGQSAATVDDGDAIIFMNFRPDRARQISHALVDGEFDGFARRRVPDLSSFVMATEYEANLDVPCAYPPENLVNSLGEHLSNNNCQQLRIAETEKYAHVTFFFSGGREALFDGEKRILVPSPKVDTYDQMPEMSAPEVTEKLVEAIQSGKFDCIICNYANCDQVGHTGDFEASIKAVEVVDSCLKQVLEAVAEQGGQVLITADHGNVEEMFDDASNQPHTQHTTLPVPLVYAGPQSINLDSDGSLADIAPSILALMGLDQPEEMSGRSLILR